MLRVLDQLLRFLLILCIAVLTVTVFMGVLTRFVFKVPLAWTEEVTRIAFVYSIFLGATLGVRDRAHINIDVIVAQFPPGGRLAMKLVANALVALFLCFMIWQGVDFVAQTGVQMTPVLLIPFRVLYLVIPISGILMLLYLILSTVDDLRRARTP